MPAKHSYFASDAKAAKPGHPGFNVMYGPSTAEMGGKEMPKDFNRLSSPEDHPPPSKQFPHAPYTQRHVPWVAEVLVEKDPFHPDDFAAEKVFKVEGEKEDKGKEALEDNGNRDNKGKVTEAVEELKTAGGTGTRVWLEGQGKGWLM